MWVLWAYYGVSPIYILIGNGIFFGLRELLEREPSEYFTFKIPKSEIIAKMIDLIKTNQQTHSTEVGNLIEGVSVQYDDVFFSLIVTSGGVFKEEFLCIPNIICPNDVRRNKYDKFVIPNTIGFFKNKIKCQKNIHRFDTLPMESSWYQDQYVKELLALLEQLYIRLV